MLRPRSDCNGSLKGWVLSRAELGFGVSWGWGEVGGEFGAEAGEAFGEDLEDCRLWAVGSRVKGLRPHAAGPSS